MKLKMLGVNILVLLCLTITPLTGFAATAVSTEVTLEAFALKVQGDAVTIRGTSSFEVVNVEVQKPDGSILYFSARKVVNGKFSASITLPSDAPTGLYKVAAGQNTSIALQDMNVIAQTVYQNIDINHDNQLGIDDIISFISSGGADLNNDKVFDRNDIQLILSLIKPMTN